MAVDDQQELPEAIQEQQNGFKQQAAEALDDGNKELALEKMNEAIALGCTSAMLYAKRAQIFLSLSQLDECVQDCEAALKLNPDSAKAYKMRARAYVKQEKFVEANLDFAQGQKIDFDDDTADEHKEIEEKAKEGNADLMKKRIEDEKAERYRVMMENKKKYEEGVASRDKEMRDQRMADDKEKEDQKEGVKQRNRDRWAREEEEKKKQEEEEEEIAAEGEKAEEEA